MWEYVEGDARGIALTPLYAAAPKAALQNPRLYKLLALTDALRANSRVRERDMATKLLTERLEADGKSIL